MGGSDPDRALYGNSLVLKSALSLTEVEQLIDYFHPRGGGEFKKRKAQFTRSRNSYYCGKGEEVIVWIIAVFFSGGDLLPNGCKCLPWFSCASASVRLSPIHAEKLNVASR